MLKYFLKRAILIIPTLLIILTIVFILMRCIEGSPAYIILEQNGEEILQERVEEIEDELGINDPIIVQYGNYLKGIVTGDWGKSYMRGGKDVFDNMKAVWEPNIVLAIYATVITVLIGLPIGILSATHRNSALDYAVTSLSMVAHVIPGFVAGLLLIYFFGVKLHWFPVTGYRTIAKEGLGGSLYSLTLPAFALGLAHVASLVRYTRSCMLDVLSQDYIRTARAKGLSRNKVYYKHALKNTLSIVGTQIIYSVVAMIGGATVVEKVFNINGMGTLAVDSMGNRDYPQEQAIVLVIALISLGLDLLMDVLYKLLDPRIEYD